MLHKTFFCHKRKFCEDELNVDQFALEECHIDGLAACSSTENTSRTNIFLDSGSHITDQQWMLSNFTPFKTNSRWINGIGGA